MANDIIPYQEVKLENQSVDEIVEDIGILKKIEEASKFEIGRRLVYLKETCKHGEYLPKLEEIGLTRATASIYVNFYCRFGQLSNVVGTQHLGYQKIRELLRIPKGSEEEYLNKIPNPDEVTAKQLREEIDKLREEKEQEKLAKEVLIKNNQELQEQLEKEKKTKKTEYITNEVVVEPSDYSFIKDRLHELECNNKALEYTKESLFEELEKIKNSNIEKDEQLKQYEQLNRKLNELGIGMEIRDQYLEDTTELASLVGSMRYFFNEKLAPVKYERCLKYYKCDNSVVKSLRDIIEKTEDWLVDIKQYLPESNLDNTVEIIDVEVK